MCINSKDTMKIVQGAMTTPKNKIFTEILVGKRGGGGIKTWCEGRLLILVGGISKF